MKKIFLFALLCLCVINCQNNDDDGEPIVIIEPEPEPEPDTTSYIVTNLTVADIGDAGDASDIEVRFSKAIAEEEILHYRIILNNINQQTFLTQQEALQSEFYDIVQKTGSDLQHQISVDTKDFQGSDIQVDVTYQVYVLAYLDLIPFDSTSDLILTGPVEIMLSIPPPIAMVTTIASGFNASGGIVIDNENRIYVGNFGTGTSNGDQILRFQPDGSGMEVFANTILGATGGAFDADGNLFWSGYSENRVHKISPDGTVENFASIPGPVAIKINQSGDLFVCACNDNSVRKITADGIVSTYAQSVFFNCPNGMALDELGNLYVSNFSNGLVTKIDQNGNVSSFANVPGNNSVNLALHDGYIYVTARAVHKIYRIKIEDQSVELYTGSSRGQVDGNLDEAKFALPNGIAISLDGTHLLVNDVVATGSSFNPNSLRKVEIN